MAAKQITESIGAELTVPERLLFFCVASDTDFANAGIPGGTTQQMQIKNLIERDGARFVLTQQGRAVLAALLGD
jgi:hypothetical protein